MTGLTSMLVPLRTLPGWPDVEDPSVLMELLLFLGLPAAGLLLIYLLGQVTRLMARSRGETGPEIDHPLSIWGVESAEQYQALVRGEEPTRAAIER